MLSSMVPDSINYYRQQVKSLFIYFILKASNSSATTVVDCVVCVMLMAVIQLAGLGWQQPEAKSSAVVTCSMQPQLKEGTLLIPKFTLVQLKKKSSEFQSRSVKVSTGPARHLTFILLFQCSS